ncbi:MAG: MarR family transcriptional regulator [Pseudomonadota bacterium]
MTKSYEIAKHIDRFMRKFDAATHARATQIDNDKIGQLGGLVLLSIADLHPVSLQELVKALGRDKSQMTRLVQMLELKGVIARKPSPTDGRVSLLHPTEKGCALVAGLRQLMSEVVDEIVAPLPAEERDTLARLLRKL